MSGRGKAKKTLAIEDGLVSVLKAHHPMTVRQAYYQLVAAQIIPNTRGSYQIISGILVDTRKSGAVPWEWVEDRLRQPRAVSMWSDLTDFAETATRAYRRDVWEAQPEYLETWLEKDALSGIFEDVLEPYGATLNVGRGYDGWSSIHNAAKRFSQHESVTVLYFGDFDPSGEDMARSLQERLAFFGSKPDIIKIALTLGDIERYNLPPDPAKLTDTRAAAFIAKNGDVSVELDALPVDILRARIDQEVSARLDLDILRAIKAEEDADRERIRSAFNGGAAHRRTTEPGGAEHVGV